jgi:hypothetical protein
MIPSTSSRCAYDPEIVKIMGKAFDRACEALPGTCSKPTAGAVKCKLLITVRGVNPARVNELTLSREC